jgi:uncharacterized protein YjiS (DUF1127 family)
MSANVIFLTRRRGIVRPGAVIRQYRSLFSWIDDWRARERQWRSLARLDDRLLADIGLTPQDRRPEWSTAFWAI